MVLHKSAPGEGALMLETAIRAVQIAGEILRTSNPMEAIVWSKGGNPRDIVSGIDRRIEKEVARFLQEVTPSTRVLGEEYTPSQSSARGRVWVLDPVDGTSNYVKGLNHYAISLALLEDGKPVISVIYDPSHDQMFTAVKGEGACLDQSYLRVSNTQDLSESFICLEWGRTPESIKTGMTLMNMIAPRVREVRFLGGAALTLCYVAHGIIDLYIDCGLDIWDYAAGWLIIEEAGGEIRQVGDIEGEVIVAGNCRLIQQVLQVLTSTQAQ